MKKALIISALSSLSLASIAQCNQHVIYTSGKADFTDSIGNILRSKEGKITVELSSKQFILMHDGQEDDALRGDVSDFFCEWEGAYKNGTTTFKSGLIEKSGEKDDANVSIEGKDGNLLILVKFKNEGHDFKNYPGWL
ncbi:MAG: hypothetical protein ABI472_03870 [Ginsengibacter sp.]